MKINIILTDDRGDKFAGEFELSKVIHNRKIKKYEESKEDKSKPIYLIKKMYQKRFFKDEKKLADVNSTLKSDGYNFKKGSIQYALDSAEFLDRKGKTGSYKWIQKYPPS